MAPSDARRVIAPSPDNPVKVPAHQHVYARLRNVILFGDLAPGQPVTIQGLTNLLDAGMTPVREALRRLIAEGALIHQGNRRVSVPTLTADDVSEMAFIRKALEPELARKAAESMTPEALTFLTEIDAALNGAIDRGDIGEYLKYNYQFHSEVYRCADAPITSETVDRLWLRFGPSLRVVCGRFGTSNLPDKHADLLAAFAAKDAAAASKAMQEDVAQGMLQIQASL